MSDEGSRIYAQYRDELITARKVSFEQFDKAILSLSAGSLGVSLAFIKDVVPVERIVVLPLLICSWSLFVTSILSTLISFIFTQLSVDKQLWHAEEYYINKKEEFLKRDNPFKNATRIANVISGSCFILAIILTVLFTSINISHVREEKQMSDQDESKESRMQGGYIPSKMQEDIVPDTKKGIVISQMPKVPPSPEPISDSGKTTGSNDSSAKKE